MLVKRDLVEFYSGLASTAEIFNAINKQNKALEKEHSPLVLETAPEYESNTILEPSQVYVLSRVQNKELLDVATRICELMHEYKFKEISSVPRNAKLYGDHFTTTDYEILARINLFNHTMNCAICSIETCKDEPRIVKDIVLVIALLHDFGKAPVIQSAYGEKNEAHEKISAKFAEELLNDFDVSQEIKDNIFVSLFNYHNEDKNKQTTIYLPLVVAADVAARVLEKKFIKSRR